MLRKFLLSIAIIFSVVLLTGCNWFGSKPSDKTVAVSYEEFQAIYAKNHFNLLPQSIYNEELVTTYNNQDINSIITKIQEYSNGTGGGYTTLNSSSDYYPSYLGTAVIDEGLNKATYNKTDLDTLDFGNIYNLSNDTVSGPLDFVYSNIAGVNLYMDLFEQLNQEFAKYGEVKFDGTVITIPGDSLGTVPNPLDPTQEIVPADVLAKFTQTDTKTIMSISSENTEEYYGADQSYEVTVGLYLQMAVGKLTNGQYVTELTVHFVIGAEGNVDLDMDGTTEPASLDFSFGSYVKAVDNSKLIMNEEIKGEVHVDFSSSQPDINESYGVNSTFVLTVGDTTEVVFKVQQNALETFDLTYYVKADETKALVYVGFAVKDADFYGEEIPTEKVEGIVLYNANNEIEFVAGSADVTTYENVIDAQVASNYNYTGYAFNMKMLDGWTRIDKYVGLNTDYEDTYIIYNNDTVVFGEADFVYSEDADGNVTEGKACGGFTVNGYDFAIYVHLANTKIDISLPSGLTSANYQFIVNAYDTYIKTDTVENVGVDFTNSEYLVPALDKSQYAN